MSDRARLEIVAIWCVSAWPAINFAAANFSEVKYGGLLSLTGVFAFVLLAGTLGHVLRRWGPSSLRGAVITGWVVVMGMLFGYSAFRGLVSRGLAAVDLPVAPSICWLAIIGVLLGMAWRGRNDRRLRLATAVFGIAAFVMALGVLMKSMAVTSGSAGENFRHPEDRVVGRGPTSTHRVYYFVLDAYLEQRELARVTGFDNSRFIGAMLDAGFVDASGAPSNYIKTSQTLGGLFLLDYPQTDDPSTWKEPHKLYPEVFERTAPPPLVRRLTAMGYTFWHAASVWSGCPARHVKCLGDASGLSPDYMTQGFLAPTPFGRPLMHILGRKMDALATVQSHLPELSGTARPMFLFAHHLAPHPPYFRAADCSERTDIDDAWNGWRPEDSDDYLASLQCVNQQMTKLVGDILAADPEAIIVLQGDHGTAFGIDWEVPMKSWPAAAVRQRTSFLNLVKLPAPCLQKLHTPLGQINTMRAVVACLEGVPPEYLKESAYLSTYSTGAERRVVWRWDQ